MSRPTFLDFNPDRGFIGVLINSPIIFRAQDIHGVDISTLNINVASTSAIVNGVFQSGFEGTITAENSVPNSIKVIIYRIEQFSYSQIVNIQLQVSDLRGEVGTDEYDFLVVSDPSILAPIVSASPHGRLFNTTINVLLSTDIVPATILYTLDGSTPTLYSDTYSSPLLISNQGNTTLKAIAFISNSYSELITETYTIDSIAPVSVATPAGGSYFSSQDIVLSADDSKAVIYYTTNGSEPTTTSAIYKNPIRVRDNRTTILKFFAVDEAGNIELVHTETYVIEIAKNNFKPTNVFVTCPFNQNELYIRWDDMYPIYNQVIGYNVYRADTEMGPFQKLNSDVISVTQYLDRNLNSQIINEDVSEQFRRTINISRDVDDDFDVSNTFSASKWNEIDPAEMFFQYNGAVFKDSVGLKQTSRLVSIFKLRGNFEIRVKFDFSTWVPPDIGIQSCKFIVRKDQSNSVEISRSMSRLSDTYCTVQCVNGNQEIPITVSSIDVTGEFKISRTGEIVTTYFYDHVAQQFIQLGAFDRYTEDLHVELCGVSGDKQVEFRFSQFVVDSGNPIIIQPLNPRKEYLIYLSQRPVVDDTGLNNPTDKPEFVTVTIDGQRAYVRLLQGLEGIVELETKKQYDEVKKTWFEPLVPNEYSTVLVSYRVPLSTVNIRLRKNYFYKVTCVTSDDETDLDLLTPKTLQPDNMTYILEECVRRNAWMLEQGGERVLLYLKKKAGQKCPCTYRDMKERTHKQPDQDCEICYGSGFIGGFDGPFPILIGPLTTEQRIQQTDRGLKLSYQIETWMGPAPVVNQRDMIIRRNGDRCLVGPITPVEGPGGVRAQQHFVVEVLDGTDVRHKFNVVLPDQKMQPGIDKNSKHVLNGGPNIATVDSPKEREELYTSEDHISHQNQNVDHIVKGRSIVFENIEY